MKLKSDKAAEKKITLGTLKVRQEYLNVAASGVRGVARGLILQQGPLTKSDKEGAKSDKGSGVGGDEKGGISRIGITVTKKVGNAVERNFVKRRLRVLARTVLAGNIIQPADYVLVGRRAALKRSFDELTKDVLKALNHLKYEKRGYKPKGKR